MTTKSAKHPSKKPAKKSHRNKINRSFVAPLDNRNNMADVLPNIPEPQGLVSLSTALDLSKPGLAVVDLAVVDIDRAWVKLSPQSSWSQHREAWLMHAAECSIQHDEKGIHPKCGVWAWIPECGTVLLEPADYEMV
ncbi:MAG: hypothetical protein ACK456_07340 [Pseudanabaenaceae cyanobacterium]|jgi:hypothetical protein